MPIMLLLRIVLLLVLLAAVWFFIKKLPEIRVFLKIDEAESIQNLAEKVEDVDLSEVKKSGKKVGKFLEDGKTKKQ